MTEVKSARKKSAPTERDTGASLIGSAVKTHRLAKSQTEANGQLCAFFFVQWSPAIGASGCAEATDLCSADTGCKA